MTNSDPENSTPQLAAPGAGLPLVELLLGRIGFGMLRLTKSRKELTALFRAQRKLIRKASEACDDAVGSKRVLIKRLPGLEDSSRHWSVFMTLDHLRIVNDAIADTIRALASGEIPEEPASTADYKPDPAIDEQIRERYEASCDRLLETTAGIADLKSRARYAHPWFGPLDAAGWQALAAIHMRIHRRQIEAILTGLDSGLPRSVQSG